MNQLSAYRKNIVSQWGEDGIIEELFNRIGVTSKFCIEFGSWDGKKNSNTWNLWHEKGWSAVLIESHTARYNDLVEALEHYPKVTPICAFVVPGDGEGSLDTILDSAAKDTPIDLLSIDIDGNDYYILESLKRKPRVIIVEYNPTIPPELEIVQSRGEFFGSSALAMQKIAKEKGYMLVAMTDTNCFFIQKDEVVKLGIEVPTLPEMFPRQHLSYVVTSYDGIPYLTNIPTYATIHPQPFIHTLYSVFRKKRRLSKVRDYALIPVFIEKNMTDWYCSPSPFFQQLKNFLKRPFHKAG